MVNLCFEIEQLEKELQAPHIYNMESVAVIGRQTNQRVDLMTIYLYLT